MRTTRAAQQLAEMSEREWQTQVVNLANMLGWRKAYHVFDSRRSHSGWPDLVLVRERILYLELKSQRGKLSDAQKDWLRALLSAGGEVYVARPADLQHLATVLTRRHFAQYATPLGQQLDQEIANQAA